jgi:hypothetical protein
MTVRVTTGVRSGYRWMEEIQIRSYDTATVLGNRLL